MLLGLLVILGALQVLSKVINAPSSDQLPIIDEREVVIVGSGPSGCTAAIYTARALLKPLVVAGYTSGGQLMLTSDVENFPGYREAVTGPMMMEDLTEQAKRFGADFMNTNCQEIDVSSWPYSVRVPKGIIKAKSVILSTGADAIWLGAEKEDEFKGKGISTCATCDGFMFRDKPVIVVGGGDSAMEEATFLTRFASSVTIVHRRSHFRASKVMLARAMANSKIRIMTNTVVESWKGADGVLSGAAMRNTEDGSTCDVDCDGAFIAIGHKPNTGFLNNQVTLDSDGFIQLHQHTMTNVPGVFACGDVADKRYKQAITAAGSGCAAAIDAERWLEEQGHMNM